MGLITKHVGVRLQNEPVYLSLADWLVMRWVKLLGTTSVQLKGKLLDRELESLSERPMD